METKFNSSLLEQTFTKSNCDKLKVSKNNKGLFNLSLYIDNKKVSKVCNISSFHTCFYVWLHKNENIDKLPIVL